MRSVGAGPGDHENRHPWTRLPEPHRTAALEPRSNTSPQFSQCGYLLSGVAKRKLVQCVARLCKKIKVIPKVCSSFSALAKFALVMTLPVLPLRTVIKKKHQKKQEWKPQSRSRVLFWFIRDMASVALTTLLKTEGFGLLHCPPCETVLCVNSHSNKSI